MPMPLQKSRDAGAHVAPATLVYYGMPAIGYGLCAGLLTMYLLKYSTDVLLIAPATMGAIFGLSRLWDAVSDPIAGYLSDRTRGRFGRRRPWLVLGAVPMALTFYAMWRPPQGLTGSALTVWMAAAVLLFFTAYTMVRVPHMAWGAEICLEHHERTRVFGAAALADNLGSLMAAGGMFYIGAAADPRSAAGLVAWGTGIVLVGGILLSIFRVHERREFQAKRAGNPYRAFRDILRNPHARPLLAVFFLEFMGFAALTAVLPYASEYMLHTPHLTGAYIGTAIISGSLFVPVAVRLARRFGKKRVWVTALATKAVVFGNFFFVPEGGWLPVLLLVTVFGAAYGTGLVVGPSVKADVVDFDEYQTGERKEGAYFAAWNMAAKGGIAISLFLSGVMLHLSGFVPNVEQTPTALLGIRLLTSAYPAVIHGLALVALWRFGFNEPEHRAVRTALAGQNAAVAVPAGGG